MALSTALGQLGYVATRKRGSHIRLTNEATGQHVTVPAPAALKVGSLSGILSEVAEQLGLERNDLVSTRFD